MVCLPVSQGDPGIRNWRKKLQRNLNQPQEKPQVTEETHGNLNHGWISCSASCKTEIWRLHLRVHYKKLRGRYVKEVVTLDLLGYTIRN